MFALKILAALSKINGWKCGIGKKNLVEKKIQK